MREEKKMERKAIMLLQQELVASMEERKEISETMKKLEEAVKNETDDNKKAELTKEAERLSRKFKANANSEETIIAKLDALKKKKPQEESAIKTALDIVTTGFGIYTGIKDAIPTNDYFKSFRKNLFDKMTRRK